MEYQGPIGPATEEMDANVQHEVLEANPPAIYAAAEDDVAAVAAADGWVGVLPPDFHRALQVQWEENIRLVEVLMTKIPRTSDLSVIRQLLKVIAKKGQLTGFEGKLVRRFGKRCFCINPAIAELMLTQSKLESDPKAVQQMSSIGVCDMLSYQEIVNSVLIHFPEDGSPALIYQNFSREDEIETTRIYSEREHFTREEKPRKLRFELFKCHTLIFETPEEAKHMFSERANWNRLLLKDVVFVETKAQFRAYDNTHASLFNNYGFQTGARNICYKYTREEKVQVGRMPPINVRRTFCTAETMIDSIYDIRSTHPGIHDSELDITEADLEVRTLTVEEMDEDPESISGTKGMI